MVKADARTTVERPAPANKLSEAEVQQVLDACHRPDTAHLPPTQIVPRLADEGVYLALPFTHKYYPSSSSLRAKPSQSASVTSRNKLGALSRAI